MDAVILAGGFGTRLKTVLRDIPKPMAPVRGKPFLSYILRYLSRFDIATAILCTGYLHEAIEGYFNGSFQGMPLFYSRETEPLGTGGALKKALFNVKGDHCVVLNGDSFFGIPLAELINAHFEYGSDFTIALKRMTDFERYGAVKLQGSRIVAFEEKSFRKEGVINGGVYVVRTSAIMDADLPGKFSLEKDFLERNLSGLQVHGKIFEEYFIDIGVPKDYRRAQTELQENWD
jgi:D-glycero-alpha-D-manno-heptose 1-phosphate guanylyltransferase